MGSVKTQILPLLCRATVYTFFTLFFITQKGRDYPQKGESVPDFLSPYFYTVVSFFANTKGLP